MFRKIILRFVVGSFVFTFAGVGLIFLAYLNGARFDDVFDFTSTNGAFYIVRDGAGGLELNRNLPLEDSDRLVFEFNAGGILDRFMKGVAIAKDRPVLELTWDREGGKGGIKQYRADGSMLLLSFSRFDGEGKEPRGVFLGGDLPYEDRTRSNDRKSSGLGFYDGKRWHHVWCNSNEAFELLDRQRISMPPVRWDYIGSRILKNTGEEVVIESEHEARAAGHVLGMTRTASFRADDEYYVLRVRFENKGPSPLLYGYSWGDEPWVGGFGDSRGDVGWYADGLIWTEKTIPPSRSSFVGYWDHGNDAAGEGRVFTDIANFVEWGAPLPSLVFLSNSFDSCCDEATPLSSIDNRVVNILWLNQLLAPGESKTHTLAIGMAGIDVRTGLPRKPATRLGLNQEG